MSPTNSPISKQSGTATPSAILTPITVLNGTPIVEVAPAVDAGDGDGAEVNVTMVKTTAVGRINAALLLEDIVEVERVEFCDIVAFCVMLNGTVAK